MDYEFKASLGYNSEFQANPSHMVRLYPLNKQNNKKVWGIFAVFCFCFCFSLSGESQNTTSNVLHCLRLALLPCSSDVLTDLG